MLRSVSLKSNGLIYSRVADPISSIVQRDVEIEFGKVGRQEQETPCNRILTIHQLSYAMLELTTNLHARKDTRCNPFSLFQHTHTHRRQCNASGDKQPPPPGKRPSTPPIDLMQPNLLLLPSRERTIPQNRLHLVCRRIGHNTRDKPSNPLLTRWTGQTTPISPKLIEMVNGLQERLHHHLRIRGCRVAK